MAHRLPLWHMTPDEIWSWLEDRRLALQRKRQREHAYLSRRASRGVRTPTDEAYEADQELEADLLHLLDDLLEHLEREG